jgi:hypothetical protein
MTRDARLYAHPVIKELPFTRSSAACRHASCEYPLPFIFTFVRKSSANCAHRHFSVWESRYFRRFRVIVF